MVRFDLANQISTVLADVFSSSFELTEVGRDRWEISVPFGDQYGDPLWFSVCYQGGMVTVDDGGAVAGQLFSLEQEQAGSPAYELMSSLIQRHGLIVDHDLGVIRQECGLSRIGETLPWFTRVVLTMLTAAPHLEKKPRQPGSLGRQLRSRIRDRYVEMDVLHLVGRNGYMQGERMHRWPADFHWQMFSEESPHNVFVLTADLKIQHPLRKAERISTLAFDTRNTRSTHDLRVVIDTADLVTDEGFIAADIIRDHGDQLDYAVFDYADDSDQQVFFSQVGKELLSEPASEWRAAFLRSDPMTANATTGD